MKGMTPVSPRNMTSRTRTNRRRAFTLLEILIVIGIVLALGGIVLFNFVGVQEDAEKDITTAQIDSFVNVLDQFRLKMKRYPTEEEGLAVLWSPENLENEDDESKWRKFLDDAKPTDDWGNEWIYYAPSQLREGEPYDIISVGPDGEEGTEDDITNHDRAKTEDGDFEESGSLSTLEGG